MIAQIVEDGTYDGERVDALDGVAFEPTEIYLTVAQIHRSGRPDIRLHRHATVLQVAAAAHDRPADDPRLPLALGHRLVLVFGGVRVAQPQGATLVAASVASQRRLPPAGRARDPLRIQVTARPPARVARARACHPGHRGAGRAAGGVRELVRHRDRDASRVVVPVAQYTRVAGLSADSRRHLRQRRLLGNGADSARGTRRRPEPGDRIQGDRARRAQVAVFRLLLRSWRPSTGSTTRPCNGTCGSAPIPRVACPTSTRKRWHADDHHQPDRSDHRRGSARPTDGRGRTVPFHRLRRQHGWARRLADPRPAAQRAWSVLHAVVARRPWDGQGLRFG